MKAMIHRGAVIQRLMIAGLIILIFALLAGGLYFMAKQPTGDGPDTVAPLQEDGENRRTGALLDPNREVRGIWVPSVLNITYPSAPGLEEAALRAELDAIVKTARDANLNTVCLQVRPSSDALYASELFPTSAYLSGVQGAAADGGFDPLAYLCEIAADETEGEALAVYAWVNPLRVTSAGQDTSLLSADNPAVQHPEWTFVYNNAVYYDAGIPEVRELVAAGVREICENYPVAGVIFDDYFYPYPAYGSDKKLLAVDDADTYAAYGGAFDNIGDFRRDNVNRMVQACYEAVKSVSDYIRFGIAPFGIWQNGNGENGGSDTAGMEAYSAIYCDAVAWMAGGYIDFIAPQ
ncbi:MAG: family 10 glycosylhydrolase, partial [Clostridia bacterium]|nr:family 10 glycosylhydrolase [Clostridia bacterium]